MRFAEVTDLEARWRTLTTEEQAQAEVLLEDASAILASKVVVDPTDTEQAYNLKMVVCNMVKRAMLAGDSAALGLTQESMTAGPYTQAYTYSNPTADLYLTKTEKQLLGIGGFGKGRTILYAMAGDDDAGN